MSQLDQRRLNALAANRRWFASKTAITTIENAPYSFKLTEYECGDQTIYIFAGWALGPDAEQIMDFVKAHKMAYRPTGTGDIQGELITLDVAVAMLFKLTWGGSL